MQTDLCASPTPYPGLRRGSLYIVSTPIGHIEDITVRALRVLQEVSVIAAENAAVTRRLLLHYGIETPLISCRPRKGVDFPELVLKRLRDGESVALVSDAGTPCIADPGPAIARKALRAGIRLVAIPGPTAALAALVVSGLHCGRFAFDGFPPRTRSDRPVFFARLAEERRTIVIYETRAHLRDTLIALRDALGAARQILVARNLTRDTETLFYGSLAEAVAAFSAPLPGEYALVIAGEEI